LSRESADTAGAAPQPARFHAAAASLAAAAAECHLLLLPFQLLLLFQCHRGYHQLQCLVKTACC
jgi:hypothetical protein